MSTGLIKIENQSLEDVWKAAQIAAKSDMVPNAFKNRPDNIVVAWQYGFELGLTPMSSLQNIAVINGRPCIWGDMLLSIARKNKEFEDIKETVDIVIGILTGRCEVKRKGQTPIVHTFSMEDAKKAGLSEKDTWKKYPKRMLQMRARSYALRDAFSDSLAGFRMVEEEQDIQEKVINPVNNISAKQSINDLLKGINKNTQEDSIETESNQPMNGLSLTPPPLEHTEESLSPLEKVRAMQEKAKKEPLKNEQNSSKMQSDTNPGGI